MPIQSDGFTKDPGGSGGGSFTPPTGSGFVKVTGGVLDTASSSLGATEILAALASGKWPIFTLASVGGTANAITATFGVTLATGQFFWLIPSATSSSTTVNLDVDSVGDKQIKAFDGSTDPAVGDLVINRLTLLYYDGTVFRQMLGGAITTAPGWPAGLTTTELGYLDGVTSAIQAQLDAKAALSHTHTISQLSDWPAGLTVLELGYLDGVTSAIQGQLNGKAATSHTHNASEITAGTIATARLGSGTADSTTFLCGDQTYKTVSGGATNLDGLSDVAITSAATGQSLFHNGTNFVNRALVPGDLPVTGTAGSGKVPTTDGSGGLAYQTPSATDSTKMPLAGGVFTGYPIQKIAEVSVANGSWVNIAVGVLSGLLAARFTVLLGGGYGTRSFYWDGSTLTALPDFSNSAIVSGVPASYGFGLQVSGNNIQGYSGAGYGTVAASLSLFAAR